MRRLAIVRRRGDLRTEIDFIGVVKDDYGYTVQNIRNRLLIELTAEEAEAFVSRPIQYETGFTLLPGKSCSAASAARRVALHGEAEGGRPLG